MSKLRFRVVETAFKKKAVEVATPPLRENLCVRENYQ